MNLSEHLGQRRPQHADEHQAAEMCGMSVCIKEGGDYMRGERISALAMVGKRLCSRAR